MTRPVCLCVCVCLCSTLVTYLWYGKGHMRCDSLHADGRLQWLAHTPPLCLHNMGLRSGPLIVPAVMGSHRNGPCEYRRTPMSGPGASDSMTSLPHVPPLQRTTGAAPTDPLLWLWYCPCMRDTRFSVCSRPRTGAACFDTTQRPCLETSVFTVCWCST